MPAHYATFLLPERSDMYKPSMDVVNLLGRLWPVTTGYSLIRLGSEGDGGYLLPDCISGVELCLSPGTSNDTELEEDLARIYGIPSLLCDPEQDAPDKMSSLLRFDRFRLEAQTRGAEACSLQDWLAMHNHAEANNILLSMDIEGAEYELMQAMSIENLLRMRIISIEGHFLQSLFREDFSTIFRALLDKLTSIFDIVHMKPNNHCPYQVGDYTLHTCVELTLLSKAMRRHVPRPIPANGLPNALDRRNNVEKPDADLRFYKLARFSPENILWGQFL